MNCFHGGSQETFQGAPVLQGQPTGIEEKEEFAQFLSGTLFVPGAYGDVLLGEGCTARSERQPAAPQEPMLGGPQKQRLLQIKQTDQQTAAEPHVLGEP